MNSQKFKKIFVFCLGTFVAINIFSSFIHAVYNNKNSFGSINRNDNGVTIGYDEAQNRRTSYSKEIMDDTSQKTKVYVTQASTFGVFIPKTIILNGQVNEETVNTGDYIIRLSDNTNISGTEKIKVIPDKTFKMSQVGKNDINVSVTQDKQEWLHNEVKILGNGVVKSKGMTAGAWKGIFYFNIELEETSYKKPTADYANTPFENLTWEDIADLSDSNEFFDYYDIGETKTFEYKGQTFTAEVVGVNTYNEGEITFMTKEFLPQKYPMNYKDTTKGGWPSSDLRKILNQDVFSHLPEDLQNAITPKTLDYEVCDDGLFYYVSTVSATDKLWIPTQYELVGNWLELEQKNDSYYRYLINAIKGKQHVYEAYADITTSKDEKLLRTFMGEETDWWVASPNLNSDVWFERVAADGDSFSHGIASAPRAVSINFVI